MLGSLPGSAVFGRDVLFDIPYIADWAEMGRRKQQQAEKSTIQEHKLRLDWSTRSATNFSLSRKVLFAKWRIRTKYLTLLLKYILTVQSGFNTEQFLKECILGDYTHTLKSSIST